MELPSEFTMEMQDLLGDEYPAYLASLKEPRQYGLRVNTEKISVQDFLKICPFPVTPIPWIENGFYYDGEAVSPARHPYYYAGLYYLQEPSAMTPASRLPIAPRDKVLDVCAAPGGKATELGARLCGTGLLAANDISNSRAKGLLKNLELAGIRNLLVTSEEPGKLAGYFPDYFDKILIDAPCSGEGMFRKDAKMIRAWEEHGPDYFSKLQRSILRQCAGMLRPGGLIMYSTCTFNRKEDEYRIEEFLSDHPEFSILPMKPYEGFSCGVVPPDGDPQIADTVRIYPHRMKGEGHFMALLKKADFPPDTDPSFRDKAAKSPEKRTCDSVLPAELADFLSDLSWKLTSSSFEIRQNRVYLMPDELPDLKGLRCLRTGLFMGELKKNRFEPSQALAMSLRADEYKNILDLPVSDPRLTRYLKGETLDVSDLTDLKDTGWYLVCVDSFPLGFGKLSRGILKNKYLPGWRMTS